ncbi:MAG: cysteine desulfurase-like protein [Planctomycetota bacterium]
MSQPLDLDYVRQQFPALAGPQIFMDNAGGSLTLRNVADRVRDYLLTTDVQLGATYRTSALAAERYAAARRRLAELVNAPAPEEIIFGPSTTVLFKLLAHAISATIRNGDEIIVTRVDHEANIGCWLALERHGATVRFWERNKESGDLAVDDLEPLLNERTRLVCVTHASNIFGTITPIAEIARVVHAKGARLCVDGVAFAPHREVDVQALGADYYAFSLYKTYGPHHAILHGRRDALLEVGSANHYFFENDQIPGKLEPGNANYELSWGAAGIVDYLEELGGRITPGASGRSARTAAWQAITAHERKLSERLLEFLRNRGDIEILGLPEVGDDARVATISFVQKGRRSSEIVTVMDAHDIGIRFGHFYAIRLIADLGLTEQDGVVRVSMVHYNTVDEVDRLIRALEAILDRR